jgi:serine/threonine protein kinase/tetratricopeptide (TPR) repeat protein
MPFPHDREQEPVPGFRLTAFLGRGGFGEVWRAQTAGGAEAALKIINLTDNQGYKEFRAIRLVKRIKHPHLVPIIAFWLKDTEGNLINEVEEDVAATHRFMQGGAFQLIIAMGLCEKNLSARLQECQAQGQVGIPAEELLEYMEAAAKAIDYLNQPNHDLGSGPVAIQHCDIKPLNILIVGGSAQIADFGLARVLGDGRSTNAGGTPAYVSPELCDQGEPSRASDQYSLAITYIELRTGSLPFTATHPGAILMAHMTGKLDLSRLPAAEQEVIRRATSRDPKDRFPKTVDMVRALRQAIEQPTIKPTSKSKSGVDLVQTGTEIVPGFKLLRLLGRGGYGEVWEATAPGGKHVAVKIIRNFESVSGKREHKALELIKGVDHNHLMELHAFWVLDAQGNVIPDEERSRPDSPPAAMLVIATKLANKDLHQRFKECRAEGHTGIPVGELLRYIREAALAIDYLNAPQHLLNGKRVSIQHRDIKPENILLAADTVKVGDFGLAKVVEGTSAAISRNSGGLTLAYAAPELFDGTLTRWTDQYALALTYHNLRLGRTPFDPKIPPANIILVHIQGKLDLSHLPEGERAVIARATAIKPEHRFDSCVEMVQALELAVRTGEERKAGPIAAAPAPPPPRVPTSTIRPKSLTSDRRDYSTPPPPSVVPGAGRPGQKMDYGTLVPPSGVSGPVTEKRPRTAAAIQAELPPAALATPDTPGDAPSTPTSELPIPTPIPKRKPVLARKARGVRIAIGVVFGLALASWIAGGYLFLRGRSSTPRESSVVQVKPTTVASIPRDTGPPPSTEVKVEEPSWPKLLAKVDKNLKDEQFAEALFGLDEAAQQAGERAERIGEIELRRGQCLARDPVRSGERGKAIEALKKAIQNLPPTRLAEPCQELTRLAESTPAVRADALAALSTAAAKLSGMEKERIETTVRHLRAREIERLVPGLGPKANWAKLLEQCRAAEETGWVGACTAEALVEAAGGKPTDKQLSEAQAALNFKDVTKTGAYAQYARALIASASGQPDLAASLAAEALRLDTSDPPLLTERRARCVVLLRDGLRSLRVPAKAFAPMQAPFRGPEDAGPAARWADAALLLANNDAATILELRIDRSLVGWYGPNVRAAALANELLQIPGVEKLGPDGPPLVLARARAQDPASDEGQRNALDAYVQFVDLTARTIEATANLEQAVEFDRSVLAPALKLGAGPAGKTPRGPAQVARIQAALGHLIAALPHAPYSYKNPREQAVAAWAEAVRLDGERADYWVGQGKARLQLPNFKLDDVEKDVATALLKDPKLSSAHGLRGYLMVLRSRNEPTLSKRIAPVKEAVKAYDEALRLIEKQGTDAERADSWAGRSMAKLELANYLPYEASPKDREELLKGARDDARRATEVKDRPNPDYAWAALGNAQEDLAWLMQQTDNYERAVASFSEAITVRPDLARYWLARGRCQYRQVVYGKDEAKILGSAVDDLKTALSHDPPPEERTEASFWLAKALTARGDLPSAEKHFEEAARRKSSSNWAIYALDWAGVALEAGRRQVGDDAARLLGYARAHAEDVLKQGKSPEASRILGQTYEIDGQPRLALEAYLAGLPLEDLDKADRSHLGLLLARIECVKNNREKPDFKKQLPVPPLEVARRDADRAVQLASNDPAIPAASQAFVLGASGVIYELAAIDKGLNAATRESYRKTVMKQMAQAIELAPNHNFSWVWRGTLGTEYMIDGRYKEALPLLQEALNKATPDSQQALGAKIDECKKKLGQ